MKPFENRTKDGNEKSIRRGKRVPKDAINLAWTKTPRMTPEKNVVMLDTSQVVNENSIQDSEGRKLYYANSIGVLEDRYGNQLIEDQHPVVTDEFLKDEDFSTVPAEEYEDEDILPFVHKSRFFHIDHAGLTLPGDLFRYEPSSILVADKDGNEYLDAVGERRYKVKIYNAYQDTESDQNAYRLHVFVDDDAREDLFLSYNKIELDSEGKFLNHKQNHREILNPLPFFEHKLEESEVVDYVSRDSKIYSSRPTSLKEQILGEPLGVKDGYKVYVPKKAVGDPREFQLFRWRVSCKFIQQFKVDPSSPAGVRCGVIVTGPNVGNNWIADSRTPYAFLNLSRSQYNATGMRFYNPVSEEEETATPSDKNQNDASYWYVNFDTVSNEDLKKFDVLIWAPITSTFDFSDYAGQIKFFTEDNGGTIFFDTGNRVYTRGMGIQVTSPVSFKNGKVINKVNGAPEGWAYVRAREVNINHELFSGALKYGGWNFNDTNISGIPEASNSYTAHQSQDEYESLSLFSSIDAFTDGARTHFVNHPVPQGWESMYRMRTQFGGHMPGIPAGQVATWKGRFRDGIIAQAPKPSIGRQPHGFYYSWEDQYSSSQANQKAKESDPVGHFIYSTIGVLDTCNMMVRHDSKKIVSENRFVRAYEGDDSKLFINSGLVEGAYKFLFNVCLVALKNKPLDSSDEQTYSTSYTVSSDWKSSWVINGDVLSGSERSRNGFAIMPTDSATPSPVWQRQLSDMTLKGLIDEKLTPEMRKKVTGARREYFIDTTNSNVETPIDVGGSHTPHAWTLNYSPEFTIPVELGPNVVREEDIKAEYEAGQYIHKTYPAKPYDARVRIKFVDTEELNTVEPVKWTIHGTVTETIETGKLTPAKTTTKESEVQLNWKNDGVNSLYQSGHPWEEKMFVPRGIETWQNHNYYNSKWGTGSRNWPSYGLYMKVNIGARGEVVSWIQDAMNVFQYWGIFRYKTLKQDGHYGNSTKACIRAFQVAMGAKFRDGVVDAETLAIMGTQIIRLGNAIYSKRKNSGWSRFYFWPRTRITREALSDGDNRSVYAKRSWISNGPSVIWDMFMIQFKKKYNIHGVTFRPFVEGRTSTVMFRSIDVRSQPFNLVNYDSRWGSPIWMPHRPRDNKAIYVPFRARRGDTLIVGVGQDGASGHGSSRMLGVRDIRAHARVKTTTVTPGVNTITKQTKTRDIEVSGVSYVSATKPVRLSIPKPDPSKPLAPNPVYKEFTPTGGPPLEHNPDARRNAWGQTIGSTAGEHTLWMGGPVDGYPEPPAFWSSGGVSGQIAGSEGATTVISWGTESKAPAGSKIIMTKFEWNSVTTDNANVIASIEEDGGQSYLVIANFIKTTKDESRTASGIKLPDDRLKPTTPGYYWRNPNADRRSKAISSVKETGWISKTDGVKVLCNKHGSPIGFPEYAPSMAATVNEQQRHYSTMSVESVKKHPSVQVGFYDLTQREFITNIHGEPEMPLIEYLQRGPSNIYIAVVSEYEDESLEPMPVDDNAPLIPHKWAMPVYGVQKRTGSKIGVGQIPKNLGQDEVWPVAIKTGSFDRVYQIRSVEASPIDGWIGDHQGKTLTAHYSIPEAKGSDWSEIWGAPYADVVGEYPTIVGDNVLAINQPPIFARTVPTANPSKADPAIPVFSVYNRKSLDGQWRKLKPSEIKDYNLSTGEIHLNRDVESSDNLLWKVDYTTDRKTFHFRGSSDDVVNLNPYSIYSGRFRKDGMHLYIVPQSVRDAQARVIPGSVNAKVLNLTSDTSIFDPYSPSYNPMAIQLGVIYSTTALDVSNLVMLDTRKRGGGLTTEANIEEIKRIAKDATSFWDMNQVNTRSYQKSGFVIVRLPGELRDMFTESEIIDVLTKNITVGVKFKIEDLSGGEWDR